MAIEETNITDIPTPIMNDIYRRLDPVSAVNIISSNLSFWEMLNKHSFETFSFIKLCEAIQNRNEDKVKDCIRRNPSIITLRGRIEDKNIGEGIHELIPYEYAVQLPGNGDIREAIWSCLNENEIAETFSKSDYELLLKNKQALLLHTVRGELDDVIRILEPYPELLTSCGTVIDHVGRTYKGKSAFQLALCAGDEGMYNKMIELYLNRRSKDEAVEAQAVLKEQFEIIFPNGIETHLKEQEDNIFDFDEIYHFIKYDIELDDYNAALYYKDNGSLLCEKLNKFQITFEEKSKKEKVFNPKHLLKAYLLYLNWNNHDYGFQEILEAYPELEEQYNFGQMLGGSFEQNLFFVRVVGYIQRFLPGNYLNMFAQNDLDLGFILNLDKESSFFRTLPFTITNYGLYNNHGAGNLDTFTASCQSNTSKLEQLLNQFKTVSSHATDKKELNRGGCKL